VKISDFRITEVIKGNWGTETIYASVTVESGFLWWKTRECKEVFRESLSNWRFLEDGEHTPNFDVEELHASYKAKEQRRIKK
jgi:hypothetical protein